MKATVLQAAGKVMALLEESTMMGAHRHHMRAFAQVMAKQVVGQGCTTCQWHVQQ